MATSLKELAARFGDQIEVEGQPVLVGKVPYDPSIPAASAKIVDLVSGGIQKPGGHPPAFCEGAELAIELWDWAAQRYAAELPKGARFKWIERPILERWQITMADAKQTHRVTADRYSVYARIALSPP